MTTHLYDTSAEALKKAEASIHKNLAKGVELKKVDADVAERARQGLQLHDNLAEAVEEADLVIESVPETHGAQGRDLPAPPPSTRRSTPSSPATPRPSRSPRWPPASGRPERFAGMHFFNPVHVMKLIELIRGLETSQETIDALREVGVRMGKEIVVVNEAPGFVTSRINALIGNEAFRMLQEGVASAEDIDKALKLGLNHPMGPFEMVDLVGLDVRLSILEFLHRTLGDTYRPNQILVQHVRAGRLGRKVGRGVYNYDENGARVK